MKRKPIICPETDESFQSYKRYIKYSLHWEQFKAAYFKEHGRHCQYCDSGKNVHLHHLTYSRVGQELMEDVMALCSKCHKAEHTKLRRAKRRKVGKRKKSAKAIRSITQLQSVLLQGYSPAP